MSGLGSVLWVSEGEIGTTLDSTDRQGLWESLSDEQRTRVAEHVYADLVGNDTIWAEYHRALDEALTEVTTGHRYSVDVGDGGFAYRAFCNTCEWAGERWHHADEYADSPETDTPADRAHDEAVRDGDAHLAELSA